jgi:hypothetical protein
VRPLLIHWQERCAVRNTAALALVRSSPHCILLFNNGVGRQLIIGDLSTFVSESPMATDDPESRPARHSAPSVPSGIDPGPIA